jgi:hypothetical protein
MAGSPMKYFYREEIEEIAYRETMREIRTRRARQLARDFERHDIRFRDPDDGGPRVDHPAENDEIQVVA